MKIIGAIVAFFFLFAAYFIAFPDKQVKRKEQATVISQDNPFSQVKSVVFPFDKDHLSYGDELLHNNRYDEALAAFADIYARDPINTNKAFALIAACDTLTRKNDPDSSRFAQELCQQYLRQFPQTADAATAHFYLGYLLAEDHDIPSALAHFTTI